MQSDWLQINLDYSNRSSTRPACSNITSTSDPESPLTFPVQLPVVIHCPAFKPQVHRAPSFASQGSSRSKSPEAFDPTRSALTAPSTASVTRSFEKSQSLHPANADPYTSAPCI